MANTSASIAPQAGRREWILVAGLLFAVATALVAYRMVARYQTPGPFDAANQGLCDFHNGIFFPAMAILAGDSPYGSDYAAKYPVDRPIPFFSPGILVLHAPLTWLPLHVAEVLYTAFNLLLMIAVSGLSAAEARLNRRWDVILAIAAAMLLTRAGHITVFNGYFTSELVLATLLSIRWADSSPWKAAIALMIVSAKPTYLLPLGFLLLARGNVRALTYGAILSVLFAAIPMGWLSLNLGRGDLVDGANVLWQHIQAGQEFHRAEFSESALWTWTRLDALVVAAKWTGIEPSNLTHLLTMLGILAFPMGLLAVRRGRGLDDGLGGMTGALILVGSLVSLYHQSYDALLLVLPVTCIAAGRHPTWRTLAIPARSAAITLAAVPLLNLFSTRSALMRLAPPEAVFYMLTAASGTALVCLFLFLMGIAAGRLSPFAGGKGGPPSRAIATGCPPPSAG